jgi:predicted AAA+ superfamily ATPase
MAEEGRAYVTLDDLNERALAKADPALFVATHKPPVIIDEIQYAPELLPYIKIWVDNNDERGAYWLTGSQVFGMMQGVTETLAGRVGIAHMLGLSRAEKCGYPTAAFLPTGEFLTSRMHAVPPASVQDVYLDIYAGSSPEVHAVSGLSSEDYYPSYLQTYVSRDIRDLAQVASEVDFMRFLTAVAARTAKPVSYLEIARDAQVSQPTAKRWVSLLVTSGLVVLVPAYHNSRLKRAVKMPLLHFLDTGLCANILRWSSPEVLAAGAMAGQFFESWVFSEVYKSHINTGSMAQLYYYRDKEKNEIDLIIEQDNMLYPVEIKKTGSPGYNAIKCFSRLGVPGDASVPRIASGAVLCMIDHLVPADTNNWYVPAWVV